MHTKLAKQAAEYYVQKKDFLPVPEFLPQALQVQRACYISITEQPGRWLRAQYGEPLPRQRRLAEEIITNTVRAVTDRVRTVDLPYLKYTVAVLEPLQRISDQQHLDPRLYGLYIRSDTGKSAILLPRRVGIETPDDQIATALREARIDSRREATTLYRFKVTYYE